MNRLLKEGVSDHTSRYEETMGRNYLLPDDLGGKKWWWLIEGCLIDVVTFCDKLW